MALFIRDEAVDALANELQAVLKTATKKEAVRLALERELARAREARPVTLRASIARIQAAVAALGPSDPAFDMKKFTDEMWGDN